MVLLHFLETLGFLLQVLHTHESVFRKLQKHIKEQLVANKDKGGLWRSAYQRLQDRPVREQQPTGKSSRGEYLSKSRSMATNGARAPARQPKY